MTETRRDGFAMDPALLESRIDRYLVPAIDKFRAQKDAYVAAEGLIAARDENWVGGTGGTGRLPAASEDFLRYLEQVTGQLVDHQVTFVASLEAYADGLRRIARNTKETDEAVADQLRRAAGNIGHGA